LTQDYEQFPILNNKQSLGVEMMAQRPDIKRLNEQHVGGLSLINRIEKRKVAAE
jgi:hypothetical protein